MPAYKIALLPGDGIGPEVVDASVKVLDATLAKLHDVSFDYEELSVGAGEYLKNGDPLPPSAVERMRAADAILLGAMGLPSVRWPNGVEMTPQIDIREQLDLFNGVRPIKLFHANHTPLKGYGGAGEKDIDFVIIRENCEGLFVDRLRPREPNPAFETDSMKITRHGAERVCREAFKLAAKRRKHVTLVDKANVLPSMAFFRKVFDEVAAEFPDITTDHVYVDAMALFLVQHPEKFDVMVTENMFGDILSDLAAGIVGGMGMAPSGDIGPDHAVFQPSHGTAPTIAGQGIANPIATILSAALMLEWLGSDETIRGARLIEQAVATVMGNPANLTADLGGSTRTDEIANLVIAAL
ncbi:MAG: isocitrate/isopropylmalate dehydrogenase family protein [Synoicihabitans sp.]